MNGLKKLKTLWDENPLAVIGVVGASLAGAAKFVDAISGIQSRRAYAKQRRSRSKK